MSQNKCQHCEWEFTSQRSDKRYCSRSCKWAKERAGEKVFASETMLSLGLALKSAAPEETAGYRLGLRMPKSKRRADTASPTEAAPRPAVYWFPPVEQRSMRWDRSFSDAPYFLLTKTAFEPPRVPKATTYLIEFVAADGLVLPTPHQFEAGVIVAEASRMSWPGTHQVRQSRGGLVRNLVELVSHARKD